MLMGTSRDALDEVTRVFGVIHREVLLPESPQHSVWVSPCLMDSHPVTNAQFEAFGGESRLAPRSQRLLALRQRLSPALARAHGSAAPGRSPRDVGDMVPPRQSGSSLRAGDKVT